jgi:hypothetical protein
VTEAERLLLLLVADALVVLLARGMPPGTTTTVSEQLRDARHAIDAEAHAARQFTPQAAVVLTGPRYQEEALTPASDAHSPGTGRVG